MPSKPTLRLKWIELYEKVGHLGKVCQHFDISRSTLNKWLQRYQEQQTHVSGNEIISLRGNENPPPFRVGGSYGPSREDLSN